MKSKKLLSILFLSILLFVSTFTSLAADTYYDLYSTQNTPHVYEGKYLTGIDFPIGAMGGGTIRMNGKAERTVSMLSTTDVSDLLNLTIDASLKMVAFRTENSLKNAGQTAWTETTGMPSIWMLCMFNSTPTTTVFIPYRQDGVGNVVKDDYFGKVPADRLKLDNKMLYFKIDGKMRTKIGVSQSRAKNIVGSYDTEKNVLTLLWFNLPTGKRNYVNSQWGKQNDPFTGDVINSYNDGPLEDGSIMGPFYEIETSSPAANLKPNESIKHIQCMIHLQGDKSELAKIVQELFGVKLETITTIF